MVRFLNGFVHRFGHVSKMENVLFAPGDHLYNYRFSIGVYYQKCNLKEPYAPNPRGDPPIFIDFLLTNSSRKKRSPFHNRGGEGVGGGLVWAVRSGRSGLGS